MGELVWFWLGVVVLLSILEAVTTGLVCVWFAIGGAAGLLGAAAGLNFWWQLVIFTLVSALALALTRPLAKKHLSKQKTVPTNADRVLGQWTRVMEPINNANAAGTVLVDGKVWSARSVDGTPIPSDTNVRIVRIEGVKLLVEQAAESGIIIK